MLLLATALLYAWALRGPAVESAPVRPGDAAIDQSTLHDALRAPSFWFLTLAFGLNSFVVAAMWAHLMSAFAAKGLSQAQALAVVVWFGPAQVAGRFAYLLFGRWLAPRTLGMVVLFCLPLAVAIFALAQQTIALLVFAVLFGLANGLVTIVRGSLVPDYFGRAHIGRISGAMTAIALLSRAGAPLATAALLVALAGYREMLLVLVAIGVSALVAFASAGPPRALSCARSTSRDKVNSA